MSEAKMARASLKKTVAYANELLGMIKPDSEIEGWIQAKISEMDHHIEAVYGYYKFGDNEESEQEHSDEEYEENDDEDNGVIFVMSPTASVP